MQDSEGIQVLPLEEGRPLAIVEGEGKAHAVVWPGMGAKLRSIHRIDLGNGARTVPMRHPHEAVYYVMEGSGEAVDTDTNDTEPLRRGAMVHVDPGTTYVLSAGTDGMSLVGGPSPPDPGIYEAEV